MNQLDNFDLTISVVKSELPKLEVLKRLKEKFERLHRVKGTIIKNQNTFLALNYPSKKIMAQSFSRDEIFFEAALDHLKDPNFQKKGILLEPKTNKNLKNADYDDLFQVLRYQTNHKELLRNYYNFVFQVSSLMDLQYAYEEIETGFLLFHKRQEDWELSLVDVTNKAEVFDYLESRELLTPYLKSVLEEIYKKIK